MESKLVRGLGRWDVAAIAVNTIIGTGIFILPATGFSLIGSYSLLGFILCGLIIGLIVLCFSEVSSRFRATGGMYLYAKAAFGAEIGFEAGWLYWIVRVATFAANANALLLYLNYFVPGANEGIFRAAVIAVVVLGITVLNVVGIRESAIATNIFTVGKIVPLLIFAAVGIFYIEPTNFSFAATPSSNELAAAILILIYAFVGFEAAVIPAGETKDPERTVPFALIVALIFCGALFVIIQAVAIGTLPGLAESKTPLADAANLFLGSFGAGFIAIGALISVIGNLSGGFLASSRIPFAMAEQKELPAIFARTHSRFKTPWVAIVFTAAVIFVMALYTTFLSAVAIATTTRLIVYATTCLALPVFRQRTDVPPAKFHVPLGILASVLSLACIGWLLSRVDLQKEGIPIIAALIIGVVIYYGYRLFGRPSTEPESEIIE